MKKLILVIFLFCSISLQAQPSIDVIDYINTYKQMAITEMHRTGLPASIKLAQGIHETYAGKSELVLKSNNHFGIKCKDYWTGKKVYHDDDARGECFRSYNSPTDSYRDHSNFLKGSQRYAFLFTLDPTDYKGWAYGLKKAGYATNSKYSQIIIRLIEDYNLQQYSLIALGKLRPEEEVMAGGKPLNNVAPVSDVIVKETPAEELKIEVKYPTEQFMINNTKVIFARAGSSLLGIAQEYDISLSRLFEFNDMKELDVLAKDQLLFLQHKRKVGNNEFHIVQNNETLYDIAQAEGIRLESLVEYNHLKPHMRPATGEKLYLQFKSSSRPLLADEVLAINKVDTETNENIVTSENHTTHIVQTKETLYSIAKKYGVDVEKIRQWNKLTGFDLRIGQELVIHKN